MRVTILKARAKNRGGLEKAATRIADAFVQRGAEVTILTTGSAEKNHFHPKIQIRATEVIKWPAFIKMEQFDRFVKKELNKNSADLVFGMDRNREQTHYRAGNGVHDAYLKSRIATEGRLKYLSCLCNPMHLKILEMEKSAFENPSLQKLFTNSHMVRSQILERYKTEPKKIEVIHNGVEWHEMDADFIHWEERKAGLCSELGLNSELFQFLFVGNGYLRKGLDRLLEGLAAVKRRDFQLSVIGKDRHVEYYQAKAQKLGLGNQVRFFHTRTDIRSFYQIADVLAIPSFYDPFANVTVEALAMGLFVISSKFNGGSEILKAHTGTVIDELGDISSVARALEHAFEQKKTARSSIDIRNSVKNLDYAHQMDQMMEICYGS